MNYSDVIFPTEIANFIVAALLLDSYCCNALIDSDISSKYMHPPRWP